MPLRPFRVRGARHARRRRTTTPRSSFGVEPLEPRLALATIQATLTADNHYGLYTGTADGSRLSGLIGRNESGVSGNPGAYNWSLPETFSWAMDPNDRLYVVAWDDAIWQSLIGQFTVAPTGGDCAGGTIVTNATDWECALSTGDILTTGKNPGPNGAVPDISGDIPVASWKAIGQAAVNGSAPWGTIQGISAEAKFIWYDSLGSETAPSDARYTIYRTARSIKELLTAFPPAATPTASATLTADNHYGLFTGTADGSSLSFIGRNEIGAYGNPGNWNWSLPETWKFTPAAGEHIYVVAWDDGGPQSWIGQFSLPDGTTLVSNAQDWEAVVGAGPNPGSSGPVPSTDVLRNRIQSAAWQSIPSAASAANGVGPWGMIPGIGSTAKFIWHDKLADGSASDSSYAIYRTKKPVVACDLDVDSDTSGTLDRSAYEEGIEADAARPGVIIPVGSGRRVPMVVQALAGQAATLAVNPEAAGRVKVYAQATGGTPLEFKPVGPNLVPTLDMAGVQGGVVTVATTTWTLWIEATAASASLADIVFTLTANGGLSSTDIVRATAVAVDLDVDSNNDGTIDRANGPEGTDDPIEERSPGCILFVNSDDDNQNNVADVFDVGRVAGENDLAKVVLAAAPFVGAGIGGLVVTYDESIVRLYTRPDRSGGIVSGSPVAAGSTLYAEGRSAGTCVIAVTCAVNAARITDTVRLTVQPYPGTIDVDVDSDNNNDVGNPERSDWEETLENHPYAIGKLIMLNNPWRAVTPIVLQLPTGLPMNANSVRVRLDWNDAGPAGSVRLWNVAWTDDLRNPLAVSAGGNRILPGDLCKLSDLRYNTDDGLCYAYAEGVAENAALKTLAGVEAAPRVDERIRGTLVVNGDDAAFDEVKYLVANEDSFYYQLQTRQEVRNALASRGVYSFADMPKFGLDPKLPKDVGLAGGDIPALSPDVPGFKAMVYQDYITGEKQYVLAFGGTDDKTLFEGDWSNNISQALGGSGPQYDRAITIAEQLATNEDMKGHLVVTGHSLGGGLASVAAIVGNFPGDTFNASWLSINTLGSAPLFGPDAANRPVDAFYVDYDILTSFQFWMAIPLVRVGVPVPLDSPFDVDMALAGTAIASLAAGAPLAGVAVGGVAVALDIMITCHSMNVVLYGLLVTEGFTNVDMLGYQRSDLKR